MAYSTTESSKQETDEKESEQELLKKHKHIIKEGKVVYTIQVAWMVKRNARFLKHTVAHPVPIPRSLRF